MKFLWIHYGLQVSLPGGTINVKSSLWKAGWLATGLPRGWPGRAQRVSEEKRRCVGGSSGSPGWGPRTWCVGVCVHGCVGSTTQDSESQCCLGLQGLVGARGLSYTDQMPTCRVYPDGLLINVRGEVTVPGAQGYWKNIHEGLFLRAPGWREPSWQSLT